MFFWGGNKKDTKNNEKMNEQYVKKKKMFFHGLPTIVVRSFTIVPKNDRNDRKISYYDRSAIKKRATIVRDRTTIVGNPCFLRSYFLLFFSLCSCFGFVLLCR